MRNICHVIAALMTYIIRCRINITKEFYNEIITLIMQSVYCAPEDSTGYWLKFSNIISAHFPTSPFEEMRDIFVNPVKYLEYMDNVEPYWNFLVAGRSVTREYVEKTLTYEYYISSITSLFKLS
jgi:hypothetical protein